jgi:hypothetical protein
MLPIGIESSIFLQKPSHPKGASTAREGASDPSNISGKSPYSLLHTKHKSVEIRYVLPPFFLLLSPFVYSFIFDHILFKIFIQIYNIISYV